MSSHETQGPTSAPVRASWRVARALLAISAVVGVVAMHGLTMNHGSAMAGMTAVGHASTDHFRLSSSHQAVMAGVAAELPSVASATSAMAAAHSMSGEIASVATVGQTTDGMATGCVAFLTTILLLLGMGRLVTRVGRDNSLDPRLAVAWFATAVERVRPGLAELSVLRT